MMYVPLQRTCGQSPTRLVTALTIRMVPLGGAASVSREPFVAAKKDAMTDANAVSEGRRVNPLGPRLTRPLWAVLALLAATACGTSTASESSVPSHVPVEFRHACG